MTRTVNRSARIGGRGLVVLLLWGAGFLVVASPAHACSCAETDLDRWLPEAEGAFVGVFVERNALSQQRVTMTFEVQRVVKGEFGPTAVVRTNAYGASCGLELLDGPRTGLLLDRAADGVWESGLCQQVPPEELLAFAPGVPPDPGVEPIGPHTGWPWWVYAFLGSFVVGGALFLAMRSRRRSPA
jgi:hypothetical protein